MNSRPASTGQRFAPARQLTWLPDGARPIGVGWRWEIDDVVAALLDAGKVGFLEVVCEVLPRKRFTRLPATLRRALDAGVPVIPHGVGAGLGSAWPVPASRLDVLAGGVRRLRAPYVSEHIAFVRAPVRGVTVEVGHLMPVPRTEEALGALAANIEAAQRRLQVPLVLEPIASLLDPGGDLDEPDFVRELVRRTGVGVLLDVANVYANAVNARVDAAAALQRYPLEAVRYCHVAGGQWRDGVYHDTHIDPVPEPVYELIRHLSSVCAERGVPCPPLLLERDGHYAGLAAMARELNAIAEAVGA